MSLPIYAPPASPIPDTPGAPVSVRWRGAAIFSALPLLAWLILQGAELLQSDFLLNLKTLEPTFVIGPIGIVMAATGAAAALYAGQSWRRTLLAAACIALVWTCIGMVAGNIYHFLTFQRWMSTERQVSAGLRVMLLMLPLALTPSALLHWLVRRAGRRA